MEPFAVHCTTCRARLVVRDPAAIGQILACPRCSGMVLIEAPPGVVPTHSPGGTASPPASSASSASASPPPPARPRVVRPKDARAQGASLDPLGAADTVPDAFGDLDDLLQGGSIRPSASPPPPAAHTGPAASASPASPPRSASPARSTPPPAPREPMAGTTPTSKPATGASAVEAPPVGPGAPGESPDARVATSAGDASLAPPLAPPAHATASGPIAAPPELDAVPSAERRWNLPLVVGGAAVLGVGLALTAAWTLLQRYGDGRNATVADGGAGTSNSSDSSAPGSAAPRVDGRPGATAVDPRRPSAPDAPTDAGSNGQSGSKPQAKPDSPADDQPAAAPDDSSPADDGRKPNGEEGASPSDSGEPRIPQKPSPGEAPGEFAPKPTEKRPELPAIGGKFADLLNNAPRADVDPGEGDAPGDGSSGESSKPGEKPAEKPSVAGPAPPARPLARDVDVEARLTDPLVAATYDAVPLLDFLQEISELSTIPITVDLDQLALRQIPATTAVSVKLDAPTVGQLLTAALEPLGLTARVAADSQLVVGAVDDDARRTATYDVADLTGGDESSRETLADWLTTLVLPEAWESQGGAARLTIAGDGFTVDGTERLQRSIGLFLDRLRISRKRKPVGKYSTPPAGVDAVAERGAAALQKPIKLNFNRPVRLSSILQRLGRESGVRIVPHWQSLASIGWTTDTQTTLVADGRPLAQVLETLLAPMELTFRVVDDATLEVLTTSAAAERLQIEWHSAPPDVSADETPERRLRRMEAELGEARFVSGGGRGVLRYDPSTGAVIGLLPDADHRRLAARRSPGRAAGEPADRADPPAPAPAP